MGGVQCFFRTRKLLCRRCGLSVHTPHPPGSTPLHPVQAVLIPIWSHRSSSSGPSGPHHHGPSVANPSSDIIMVPFWKPVVRPFWFPSSGPSGSRRPALLVPVVRSFLFPSSGPLFPSSRPSCFRRPALLVPRFVPSVPYHHGFVCRKWGCQKICNVQLIAVACMWKLQ